MIDDLFTFLSRLQPGQEVLLGSIAEQVKLAPEVIAALLLGAEDKGLLTCYAPDKDDCRWVVNGNLGAWIEQQKKKKKVSARVPMRQQMWRYMQRKGTFAISDLVSLGHNKHTVANYVKRLRKEGELSYLGRGIYSCRWEEVK